jgi:hypothetical protein
MRRNGVARIIADRAKRNLGPFMKVVNGKEIDTFNKFGVAMQAGVVWLDPPRRITRQDALLLAAYLVCMADPGGDQFPNVLVAVQNT